MYAGTLSNEEILTIGEEINALNLEIDEKTEQWLEMAEQIGA